MRRHPVEGAEILRRTPEMPILAPVVAFEHHLRLDGTGYPDGAKRSALNLGTMICSIADVYDAMRSQRAYQQALPDRSRPRGPQERRRRAVRAAARAPLRAAARHLSAGHARQAGVGRGRGRDARPRARSVPAARQGPLRRRRHALRHAARAQPVGADAGRLGPPTASSRRSIATPYGIDPLDFIDVARA